MAERYDVIVVGAGPAGAFASLLLSRGGKKVLLLDKASFPRPKVCGHALNPRALALLTQYGLRESFNQLPSLKIEGIRLLRDEETLFRRNLDDPSHQFLAVDREMSDGWWVQQAMQSGVTFLHETRVQSVTYSGKVETSVGDYQADWILGADGRNSIVARSAGLMGSYEEPDCVGWQAQFDAEGLDQDLRIRLFSRRLFSGLSTQRKSGKLMDGSR